MPRSHYVLKSDDEELQEDLRELARLTVKLFGEGASEFAVARAGELKAAGDKQAATVWEAVEVEIGRLQALDPDSQTKH